MLRIKIRYAGQLDVIDIYSTYAGIGRIHAHLGRTATKMAELERTAVACCTDIEPSSATGGASQVNGKPKPAEAMTRRVILEAFGIGVL